MLLFCQTNAVKDEEIKTPFMTIKTAPKHIQNRNCMYQMGRLEIIKNSREPVKEFYQFTTLPARFLTNIEHYVIS
ncbi:MAG: hypothetical protein NTU49_01305 [Gammaproteobacteria bacterium]|nr:hypothetical protein [Gammaproteobacteria bacterium]